MDCTLSALDSSWSILALYFSCSRSDVIGDDACMMSLHCLLLFSKSTICPFFLVYFLVTPSSTSASLTFITETEKGGNEGNERSRAVA